MKVLHCNPGMGGGGAERQLAYLAGPLIARGWDVHVALAAGGPNLPRLQAGGAVIHRLTSVTRYDPRLAWQLASIVRHVKPDLVQVWFVQMEAIAGAVCTLSGVPWILSERSSILAYPTTCKNRLRVAIARRAAAIVSNSSCGDEYRKERTGSGVLRFITGLSALGEGGTTHLTDGNVCDSPARCAWRGFAGGGSALGGLDLGLGSSFERIGRVARSD